MISRTIINHGIIQFQKLGYAADIKGTTEKWGVNVLDS